MGRFEQLLDVVATAGCRRVRPADTDWCVHHDVDATTRDKTMRTKVDLDRVLVPAKGDIAAAHPSRRTVRPNRQEDLDPLSVDAAIDQEHKAMRCLSVGVELAYRPLRRSRRED